METTTREYIEQLTKGVNDFIHIEYDECTGTYIIEFEYYDETATIFDITENECSIIAKVLYKVTNI